MGLTVGFLVFFPHSFEAFAQQEKSQYEDDVYGLLDIMRKGFIQVFNQATDAPIEENILNTTQQEIDDLRKSSEDTLESFIQVGKNIKTTSQNTSRVLLPWEVDIDILFIVAMIVTGLLVLGFIKPIFKHFIKLTFGILVAIIILIMIQVIFYRP